MKFSKDDIFAQLYVAYVDARKSERSKLSQINFEVNQTALLFNLANQVSKRKYTPSTLTCFVINDPVKREIFAPAFIDRIISHFIYNNLKPIFERSFIYDSYSCRDGKGTSFGIERAIYHAKSCTNNYTKKAYILSIDISGYFMSINQAKLYEITKKLLEIYRYRRNENNVLWDDIVDFDLMYYLIEKLIFRDPLSNCNFIGDLHNWDDLPPNKSLKNSPPGTGLIIGDLMSQVFSNIYLGEFDQFVKRKLGMVHYGRYVDDAFIMHTDKEKLKSILPEIEKFLKEELYLEINKNKTKIRSLREDFRFLGVCIRKDRTYIRNRTVKKFKNAVYKFDQAMNALTDENDKKFLAKKYLPVFNSYLGYFSHHKTFKIRSIILKSGNITNYYEPVNDIKKLKLL